MIYGSHNTLGLDRQMLGEGKSAIKLLREEKKITLGTGANW
ncbi:hypothetical protein ACSVDA_16870 [Cytobacillus sp. Hm23]